MRWAIIQLESNALLAIQHAEIDTIDQRGDPDRVVALARQEVEAGQFAQCVGERQDLGGPTAIGLPMAWLLVPFLSHDRGSGP